MSVLDTVLGDTVGIVWSAASGTVDPWTKAALVDNQADDLVQASGGALSSADAHAEASATITAGLSNMRDGVSADPSNFWGGLSAGLTKASNLAKDVLPGKGWIFAVVALALVIAVLYVLFLTPAGARLVS